MSAPVRRPHAAKVPQVPTQVASSHFGAMGRGWLLVAVTILACAGCDVASAAGAYSSGASAALFTTAGEQRSARRRDSHPRDGGARRSDDSDDGRARHAPAARADHAAKNESTRSGLRHPRDRPSQHRQGRVVVPLPVRGIQTGRGECDRDGPERDHQGLWQQRRSRRQRKLHIHDQGGATRWVATRSASRAAASRSRRRSRSPRRSGGARRTRLECPEADELVEVTLPGCGRLD